MLDREKVIVALEAKADQFSAHFGELGRLHALVQSRLVQLRGQDRATILRQLDAAGIEWPGALPTAEFDAAPSLCIPFDQPWQTHEEARAWAATILGGRAVAAVDGSQITPTKDFNIPVGAVQVGWFVNYHVPGGRYIKDVSFDVLGPAELTESDEDDGLGERVTPNWRVNQERFRAETARLCLLMQDLAGEPNALCLFDGSFIVSFAGTLRPQRAAPYLEGVIRLLRTSREAGVPVAAFIDRSYSRDFVALLDALSGSSTPTALSDAALFDKLLPNWGDRTPFFICARYDGISREGRAGFYREVAFTYMRLTRDRAPARIELPAHWVETGHASTILDTLRAECVVGAGYPYAIETADALAVIGNSDRERFYALLEQFAQRAGLTLIQTRKAASKLARR